MKESVLRTLVPIIYALILKSGVGAWLGLNDAFLQSAAALLGAGLIYVALRYAEQHQAAWGWLLGYASQPTYSKPVTPAKKAAAKKAAPAPAKKAAHQPVHHEPTKKAVPRKRAREDGFLDPFVGALQISLVSALLIAPLLGVVWAVVIMIASLIGALGFHHRSRVRR